MSTSSVSTVSVIIPAYNRKHLLESALKSALSQTHLNIEVIVVDDCSNDGTSSWIRENFPMVQLISLKENHGAAGARNIGIDSAKGDYIAFLDSDDYWSPDYLEKAISILSKDKSGSFCFCDHRELIEETGNKHIIRYKPTEKYRDLIHRSLADVFIFTMSVVVVRTSAIRQAGLLNETLDICHDRELYIRLLGTGNMVHIPEVLVTRVIHNSNISSDYRSWAKYVFVTLDIFFSMPISKKYSDLERDIRSDWALVIAREIWRNEKSLLLYIWMLIKALKANPQKILNKLKSRFAFAFNRT